VEEWLSSIGLGDRVPAFRAQGISADQLGELTDDDLRELGLTIGERKRFRRAIAARHPVSADEPLSSALPVLETTRAERRPLTMMFVDLVNSSRLGERLEPEDLLEVIRRYREFCGTAITRYGGHIARLVGDGVLAYFCYPVANENDPERAVRAGLEIARRIGELVTPAGEPLNVRIGIATGRVIVSDLFAGGEDRRSIIGSTPNLAARLQAFAASGGVVIADETHDHVAALFSCEDLGEHEVRGLERRHRAWRVLGEAPTPRTHYKRRPRRLTAFHDRVEEFRILAQHWQQAREGRGCTLVVIGEGGIGKSRLVQQFLATAVDARTRVVHLAASAFDEDSPLRPVIAFLRSAARLDPDASKEARLARLARVLAGEEGRKREVLPLFGELVGIATDDPAISRLPPEVLRERLLAMLVEQFRLAASDAPLIAVVEDLHWLDPTSRELLERVVRTAAGHTAMLLLTTREGFEASWLADCATVLPLGKLPNTAAGDMVRSLFGDRPVPPQLMGAIARRTDGVPLHIEAVMRSLLQLPALPELDSGQFDLVDLAIPASLSASLMARLDRSGGAKQIAQVAAVVGRSVRRDVLAETARLPDAEMEQALASLVEADLLFPDDDGGKNYTFTHALLRDAAYDSLLRDDRRALHLRVARALQHLDPHTVEQQPEVFAHHLTEAGVAQEAASYWMEAARRSLARSALTEATRLLRHGLEALERLPPVRAVLDLRLQLSGLLGPALIGLKGPGSPEAQELYGKAYELCREVPEEPSHFPIYWAWWRISSDFPVKRARAAELLTRARSRGDPELLLQAHHCNWAERFEVGDFDRCCDHINSGLQIYQSGDFTHHARLYGNHDAKVCAHGELAQVRWMQGRPISALAEEREALRWAERMDHLGSRVHAMDMQLLHRTYRRDHDTVRRLADELASFTSSHGLADHRAKALIFRGWAVAAQGDAAAGLRTLQEGFDRQRQIGTKEDFPIYCCLLAEALALAGQPDKAANLLAEERKDFEHLGLAVWMAELLRVQAEMMLRADSGSAAAAISVLTEAGELAARQQAHMLGLRIAITGAGLDMRRRGPEHAARRLARAIARVMEDDGSSDLLEARALEKRLRERLGTTALTAHDMPHE
jgi:predicted ATPase/class 3 adenylate cyclase